MKAQPVKFIHGINVSDDVILDNISTNIARKDVPRIMVKKAVVCGGGPSLVDHLDEIRQRKAKGFHVYALNRSAKFLKSHGIQPNAIMVIDARPQNIEFVTPADPEITYFLGAQVNPSLFEVLKGHKVHMVYTMATEGAVDLILKEDPHASILTSASTVGLQVLNLLHVLGYMVVDLYGYDSSHRDGSHHAYDQSLNDGQKEIEFVFQGQTYLSSGPMASQAQQFIHMYKKYTTRGMRLEVHGEGLLPDWWRYATQIEQFGSLEDQEAIKYQKMWSIPEYRKWSPGHNYKDTIVQTLAMPEGASLVDFGCGAGRLSKWLVEQGYQVTPVDIASNCLDDDVRLDVVLAPLWDLPDELSGDYGVCCDVMEHIPLDRVGEVLDNISRSVSQRVFFSISTINDVFGNAIGERLHLTVRPANWWLEQLQDWWPRVEVVKSDGRELVAVAHKESN